MRCLSVCIYSFQWSSSWPQSQQFCGEGSCKETQTHPLKDKKTTTHTLILYCHTTNPINYNGSLARALCISSNRLSRQTSLYHSFATCLGNRHKQKLAALLRKLALTYWEVCQWKTARPRCLQEALPSCLSCRAGCHKICSSPGSHTCF